MMQCIKGTPICTTEALCVFIGLMMIPGIILCLIDHYRRSK